MNMNQIFSNNQTRHFFLNNMKKGAKEQRNLRKSALSIHFMYKICTALGPELQFHLRVKEDLS